MRKIKFILITILIFEIGYFFYRETNDIIVNTQEITDGALANILGDLRVIQISDLHIKKFGVREKRLIRLIDKINPDIIFITGDFISRNKAIKPCIKIVGQLVSKCPVIAVLGNGDHSYKKKFVDTEWLIKGLKEKGVKILVNESIRLTVKETGLETDNSLYIIGLDDNYRWLDDIFKATRNVPENSPKILLAHSPNIIEKINIKGINLILSGHTHGGQIVLPFIVAIYTNPVCNARKKFISGLYMEDTKLYVNRGIGTSGICLRLFCKPEITMFKFNY